ncbi:MAG: L,D-transpeptidase [Synechococcaceae cyanobacterium]|nr:L,D-transpeptidase [Synechococcaceae cyanobacterium]
MSGLLLGWLGASGVGLAQPEPSAEAPPPPADPQPPSPAQLEVPAGPPPDLPPLPPPVPPPLLPAAPRPAAGRPQPPRRPGSAPAAKPAAGKGPRPLVARLVVDLSRQELIAYDSRGRTLLRRAVSTGLPVSPTPRGSFVVAGRYERTSLVGPDYRIEGVRHVLCLAGPGLRPDAICFHPAPWQEAARQRFGVPRSHGCIRTPSATARWLFENTPAGTPVRIQP